MSDASRTGAPVPAPSVPVAVVSWIIVVWIWYVFLGSLPYKFTLHPDTQHIFGTIGAWLGTWLGNGIGGAFASVGSYAVGAVELLTSLVLAVPLFAALVHALGGPVPARPRAFWHRAGGVMAAFVMLGAVFFHLATPLGIVVLHDGQSDGGSLFYAAVSILIGGLVLAFLNRRGT